MIFACFEHFQENDDDDDALLPSPNQRKMKPPRTSTSDVDASASSTFINSFILMLHPSATRSKGQRQRERHQQHQTSLTTTTTLITTLSLSLFIFVSLLPTTSANASKHKISPSLGSVHDVWLTDPHVYHVDRDGLRVVGAAIVKEYHLNRSDFESLLYGCSYERYNFRPFSTPSCYWCPTPATTSS